MMFDVLLLITTLFCSMIAGLVFAFAVVIMPGIQKLGARGYLEAFKVMDRVIQNGQPLFGLVWIGSVLALLVTAIMSIWQLEGLDRVLVLVSFGIYLFGVQIPTFTINIPLNNKLQATDLAQADPATLAELSKQFNSRWIPANMLRTILATVTSILLLLVMMGT